MLWSFITEHPATIVSIVAFSGALVLHLWRKNLPAVQSKPNKPSVSVAPVQKTIVPAVQAQARIALWRMCGIGVIIPCASGIIYSNQVGGNACRHPVVEGAFVPLNADGSDASQELLNYFLTGPKWRGHCYRGIDEETAVFLETLFESHKVLKAYNLRVDRDRLADSMEAWIYVTFELPNELPNRKFPLVSGFSSQKGILTWPNGD